MNRLWDRMVLSTLNGGLPIAVFVLSLAIGGLALHLTSREEEPQIVVPMVDVLISAPGLSAKQVERQVTTPLEKLLAQIPGVEHVYSQSATGRATVTLRFFVGQDREDSILNTYTKIYSNQDRVPKSVKEWLVKPIEVDDVPIVLLALWSDSPNLYDDYHLRRIGDEVATKLQSVPLTGEVKVTGGRPRSVRILLQPGSLSAHKTTSMDIVNSLNVSNVLQSAGGWSFNNKSIILESGNFFKNIDELKTFVINVVDGKPVYLQDVATITDGASDPETYTWIEFPSAKSREISDRPYPMVTISVAKQRGSNAVEVAKNIHSEMRLLEKELLPKEVHTEIIRDYGKTANEKVNNLASSLGFAVVTVVIFIGLFLGWRPALVVGLAVPICYGITLSLDMLFGYTINRVTLFALILSLGLLVDDPITGIDNISRFIANGKGEFNSRIVAAMAEIRIPLLMSTITIILAFVPLAFITGLMGPYMAPMAFNVPVSVIASTCVAFFVTPWLASRLLKPESIPTPVSQQEAGTLRFYRKIITPLLQDKKKAKGVLFLTLGLFLFAATLPLLRSVPLKLLPFDNKNEIQIVIDMKEGTTLEETAALSQRITETVKLMPEVKAIATYIGAPSPFDFNGLVRHYYQRVGPHMADVRVVLVDKRERRHQSHGIVLRLRALLKPLTPPGSSIKVVEVPPGPPVISTLVAEVYGSTMTPYQLQIDSANALMKRLALEPHVVEIDSSIEYRQEKLRFVVDKTKAALSGISTSDVNHMLSLANEGFLASYLQLANEAHPLPISLQLPISERVSQYDFKRLQIKGRPGITQNTNRQGLDYAPQPLVALGELGDFKKLKSDRTIYHKDLEPVVYVMAELSGRTPAEVIADLHADRVLNGEGEESISQAKPWKKRHYINSGGGVPWKVEAGTDIRWTGEGEWQITVDVFRDLGLAFAFALLGIFFVLRFQTSSTPLSLIIMSAIPLTIIGIMPGFWLMNHFGEREIAGATDPILFTATAMIGMIALAGIVVRNSLILVEFITQARQSGIEIKESLIQAGAIRMRPILLTAGTTLLGNLIITLDPVFSGLALAIIFGIIASTLFTLILVPIVYFLVFEKDAGQET